MNAHTKHIILSAFLLGISSVALAKADWVTSYDEAVRSSRKSGKPILVNFTGSDWCGWCIRLKSEVFDKAQFKKWADKNVILLELDFPQRKKLSKSLTEQNQKLARKYADAVQGFPTILFLNADGSVFGKYGYDEGGPDRWTKMASRLLPLKKSAIKR